MFNNPKSTWLPLIKQFLESWALADEDRGPNRRLVVAKNYGRPELMAQYLELEALLEKESVLLVQCAEARGLLGRQRREVLELFGAFNQLYRSQPPELRLKKVIIRTPSIGSGILTFNFNAQVLCNEWRAQDERLAALSQPPIIIRDNIGYAEFQERVTALENTTVRARELARQLKVSRQDARFLVKKRIHPQLVCFRLLVASQYPVDHPLRLSLPQLSPTKRRT
ncbi:MAG: hypothetical protein SFY80_13390 [Verrucomicrobiota bacterium]|nr:hypothetical protein [Verrucomicrobiota bacterium]